MKDVEFLIGKNVVNAPRRPYADDVCDFLNELSAELMKFGRAFPDVMSLGFWCRKGNVQKLKAQFGDTSKRVGRGICFHVAPSNIPVNFAFTYIFGLLAGNANIVRMPSKNSPQTDVVCDCLRRTLPKYPHIAESTAFVRYPRESDASASFSMLADARMIWGGNATVGALKALATKPRCIDIAFADRYSICVIDAEKILSSDAQTVRRLAENFYNDTYLMDQNACSSPQLVCWLNDTPRAREIFWNAVYSAAEQKYVLQDAACVDKYTKLCENAVNFDIVGDVCTRTNLMYLSQIKSLSKEVENVRGKCGYFYEYALASFEELLPIIDEKYQTLTYFGIDADSLADELTARGARGIDRIVPIGSAMDIGVFWDGFDLVSVLSRRIAVS